MRGFFLVTSVFFSVSRSSAQHSDVTVGGDRLVTIHGPSSYDADIPMPLVLLLHGYPRPEGTWLTAWRAATGTSSRVSRPCRGTTPRIHRSASQA